MTDGFYGDDDQSAEATREKVSQLQTEKAAIHDRMLRALAESENTRSRAERSVEEARKYAVADFARQLLPVVDNLDRAVSLAVSMPGDCDASLIEGVLATQRLLMSALERFNIHKVPAIGMRFDPAIHEALTQVEDKEHEAGTIIEVFEEGYSINDRLLRPARVVIAKRHADPSPRHH